jgi:fluoroquinolone transport system permease protein
MKKQLHADFRLIKEDPMIFVMFLAPLLLMTVIKLAFIYLLPLIEPSISIDLKPFITACVLTITAGLLGVATTFMLIEDKDNNIYEFMQVTPLGRIGYLKHRLFVPIIFSFIYVLTNMTVFHLNPLLTPILVILVLSEIIIVSLLLFHFSDDKLMLLSYAKGVNLGMIFSLVRILDSQSFIYFSMLIPTFWVAEVILFPTITNIFFSIIIHSIWVTILTKKYLK